jgi:hypothetical protein
MGDFAVSLTCLLTEGYGQQTLVVYEVPDYESKSVTPRPLRNWPGTCLHQGLEERSLVGVVLRANPGCTLEFR